MTQFLKSLPKELEEAASIDGARTFRTFRQIILPNAYPALAALAILRFQDEWNAFQWPLIVVRSPDHLTLPLGRASFQGLFGVTCNWVLAGAMFNALPIILLVIFFQKYLIRSAASSAVKGQQLSASPSGKTRNGWVTCGVDPDNLQPCKSRQPTTNDRSLMRLPPF